MSNQQKRPPASEVPLPVPNTDNADFWEGCREGALRLQRCCRCHRVRHTPRPACPHCGSFDADWLRASGRGAVYTFTIVHGPTLPAFQEQTPYNVIVVQLDEGPFLVSNLIDCDLDQIQIGTQVEVVFDPVTDAVTLPRFRPLRR